MNNCLSQSENLVHVFSMVILQQVTKYCGKEEKLLLRSNFSSFPEYFNISLTSGVNLHIHLWNVVVQFIFSSILQIYFVELRISRSISESPFDFEITRVDWTLDPLAGPRQVIHYLKVNEDLTTPESVLIPLNYITLNFLQDSKTAQKPVGKKRYQSNGNISSSNNKNRSPYHNKTRSSESTSPAIGCL